MSTTMLSRMLPAPKYGKQVDNDGGLETAEEEVGDEEGSLAAQSDLVQTRSSVPPYRQRKSTGWQPRSGLDFGNGGAFPEIHIAQYPLNLGQTVTAGGSRKGGALTLHVDGDGEARYDAIAKQGHAEGRLVQTRHVDMVPLARRTDVTDEDKVMDRPSEEEVQETTEKTRLALEKITNGKIVAARPKNLDVKRSDPSYIRYTPGGQVGNGSGQQRIIKMVEVQEDPMEPSKWKAKKIPRGPPSPPPPVLHSPPRKVSAQEKKDWVIPPCISNWKNTKGFTIPLDKRLSADGRGLTDIEVSDNFAKFSEALHTAERVAREDVRQRSILQQRIAEKAKADKEDYLRKLAQQAREQRGGGGGRPVMDRPRASDLMENRAPSKVPPAGLGLSGYASSDSDGTPSDRSRSLSKTPPRSRTPVSRPRARGSSGSSGSEDEAYHARERMRAERRRELERELRLNNMGKETRARVLAKEQSRDISEKIALGLAKPTMSKESMFDARLFNQSEGLGDALQAADDDSYNIYDKPLFTGSSAAAAIYGRPGNLAANDDEDDPSGGGNGAGLNEEMMKNDRFGLGTASGGRGFSGVDRSAPAREGPVQFEKDVEDPFAINAFLQGSESGSGLGKRSAESSRDQGEDRKKFRGG